ncbi:hypothetical protein PQX77_015811 [Marasmius sp. AFHP31]|nr:hypothetical protein PQX77_015811 [Marasmius sp. AFHP31]
MNPQFFSNAVNTTIGDYCTIQHVEGNVNNNYYPHTSTQECEAHRLMPRQSHFREFFEGDVFLQEETESSNVFIRRPSTNPSRAGIETSVKVVKKHHTATIFPYCDQRFTVITLEQEDKKDEEATRFLWKAGYEALSAHRSTHFPKMVGLMKSAVPSFILYQELVNGFKLYDRYCGKGIVYDYLNYTRHNAIQAVSEKWGDWSFDVNAKTWHYDIARASLTSTRSQGFWSGVWSRARALICSPKGYCYYTPIPLPSGTTPPLLNDDDIINCFEKTFGDPLYLWASLGETRACVKRELQDFAVNNLVIFGATACKHHGILAYFPSTPTPEWTFDNRSRGIKASYSAKETPTKLAWNYAFLFVFHYKNALGSGRPTFARRTCPIVDYLIVKHVVFMDEISLSIKGNFSPNLPPAYLFVRPLSVTIDIDGLHGILYPVIDQLIYWAINPDGKTILRQEEWDKYGIPKLAVTLLVGSFWDSHTYSVVQDRMRLKGYEPTDRRRYAQDHGYPELILSYPHAQRIVELNDSDTDQYSCSKSESTSGPKSPIKSDSGDGLVPDPESKIESNSGDAPECDSKHTPEQEQLSLPPKDEGTMTRWVKRLGFLKYAYISPSRDETNLPGAANEAKRKEIDSDSWTLIDRED